MKKIDTNIYSKIMTARLMFLESKPRKSGKNNFQNFTYFELSDIVPNAIRICNELGLYTETNMSCGHASLKVVNVDNPAEVVIYRLPTPEVQGKDINRNLQNIGRSETYLRRYLYLLFLDIAENDQIDTEDMNKSDKRKYSIKTRPRGRRADPEEMN